MKKYLCLLALAVVLSAGTLTGGHLLINSARDQYTLTESILAGDSSAASGLSITYRSQDNDGHLTWSTTFSPGGADQSETVFRFSGQKIEDDPSALFWRPRVTLEPAETGHGISGGGNLLDGTKSRHLLLKPFQDVASRTAPGEERTETVRLADYYEYYPMTFSAYGADWIYDSTDSRETPRLGEYFRLKVPDGEMVDVTVEKDSGGEVCSINMAPNMDDGYLDSTGVVTKHGIFLIAESRDARGTPDGRLECPDGPGVHYIPLRDPDVQPKRFDLSRLRLFYATGEAHALFLTASPDESELLLYTEEDGALRLTVLDASTGDILQQLDLLDTGAGNYWNIVENGDTGLYFALCRDSEKFSLVSREGGRYERVLCGDFGAPDDAKYGLLTGDPPVLAWDGERMAMVSAAPYSYAASPAVTAGVWDVDGLCCLATYHTGPSRDPASWGHLWYRSSEIPLAIVLTRK